MMTTLVYLSTIGRPVEPADAKVSVFDRGFLYGDSIYETMRTAGGRPIELQRHLARLRRSGEGIGLILPFSDEVIASAIDETHRASGNDESYVRIIVTRGEGPIALDPRAVESPTFVAIVTPLVLPTAEQYTRGIRAVIVGVQKAGGGLIDPGIKTGNYLNNILALRQAIARGGDDAIMCNAEGEIAEGATSNVFAVRDGEIVTPHLRAGLLPGITREVVCELAAGSGRPVRHVAVRANELRAADEVFLTSSVRGIMPVTRLDGQTIGTGEAGPITRELHERYEAYVAAEKQAASG
jgi:branched-chain amino acid aminotransferase